MSYDPYAGLVGGFSPRDGTIEFYLRIRSLVQSGDTVMDLGAGRAAWFEDDSCHVRRDIRLLKGSVRHVIAADVDRAVLDNRASDEQRVIENGEFGLAENSVDLVVADYVLEHVADVDPFLHQVDHVLKEGGWFCARTPHKFSYVALAAAIVRNSRHAKVLSRVQPNRKEVDVFPTAYKLNTLGSIRRSFRGWKNLSYVYRSDPAYFFGSKSVHRMQHVLHRVVKKELVGNLFVFCQKPHSGS